MAAPASDVEECVSLLDNLVLGVAQDTLEGALWCLLHRILYVIVFGSFLHATGQTYDWYTGGGDMQGHAS